jgi:AcrR family transcriptional regulator
MVKSEKGDAEVPAARARILEAAAQLFAERGFDGARVDEIARRASVNKALIYYYFESKEQILDYLIESTLDEVFTHISPLVGFEFIADRSASFALMDKLLDFLEERQDILRVVLMESLKRKPIKDSLFIMVGHLLDQIFALDDRQYDSISANMNRARVMEFFTGLMPIASYVVYHEIWMKSFGLDERGLRDYFIASFIDSHFVATERLYKLKGDDS